MFDEKTHPDHPTSPIYSENYIQSDFLDAPISPKNPSNHTKKSLSLTPEYTYSPNISHDVKYTHMDNSLTVNMQLSYKIDLFRRGITQIQTLISQNVLQMCGNSVVLLICHAITNIQVVIANVTDIPCKDATLCVLLQQILERMNDCLLLSTEMLYTYQFSNVPLAWRRLYAYASAFKAMAEMSMHQTEAKIIETLDMALIMTGGVDIKHFLMELVNIQNPKALSNQEILPTFHPEKNIEQVTIHFPIRSMQSPSVHTFQNDILAVQQPLIIKNSINHWPALSQEGWIKIDTLLNKTHQGLRIVPVEIGRNYTDQAWGQQLMPFYEFLKKYILQTKKTSNTHGTEKEEIGYLAQHDIFSQIPALREDIMVPDYCFTTPPPIPSHLQAFIEEMPLLHEPLLNAWFGGKGTVSPLHTDPYHNIFSQIVGWKYVRLYAPEENEALYPRSFEGGINMSNTSQIDLDNLDTKKFPKFSNAKYVEGIIGPGDCLYIPVGWWHYVRSLSVSFSVSFWWN
ncbi:unnamed protein product [Pneumocystis jirovecii]|uniref:JmjC domain-containing protein n=1 Tax=Pneumocystis jirovecii TaxID=42068 RepID=L0P858_PNEJI|nr:unnamed protein product [Pneumocystis jirovecii]